MQYEITLEMNPASKYPYVNPDRRSIFVIKSYEDGKIVNEMPVENIGYLDMLLEDVKKHEPDAPITFTNINLANMRIPRRYETLGMIVKEMIEQKKRET